MDCVLNIYTPIGTIWGCQFWLGKLQSSRKCDATGNFEVSSVLFIDSNNSINNIYQFLDVKFWPVHYHSTRNHFWIDIRFSPFHWFDRFAHWCCCCDSVWFAAHGHGFRRHRVIISAPEVPTDPFSSVIALVAAWCLSCRVGPRLHALPKIQKNSKFRRQRPRDL